MGPLIFEHMLFGRRSRHAAHRPIELNDQSIVESLTELNERSVWASRRKREGEQLYLVHIQGGTAGIGLPATVVVKKFLVDDFDKSRWKSEMILLGFACHENIIKVLRVIRREDAIMLVYEYAANGSLDYWLHRREEGEPPLSWPQRMSIAINVAQGLCHLHHGCNKPIVHHNINSTNILLDEQFNAKIASFDAAQINLEGLSQPLPIMEIPVGNFGYAAPDYGRAASQLTEKVDTYSFGVLLEELVTGWVANVPGRPLAKWGRDNCDELMAKRMEGFKIAVDMEIPQQADHMEEMAAVFRLGVQCTVEEPEERPSMLMVLGRLRRSRGLFGSLFT